ncbi:hypothetical protein MGAD_09000 [Mycolicibacterium gadium]|uniref:Uncharacterized protein n=1 Tax=Mycolicibacterium gadium TaxID=1794 RepID=A0A7I7WIL3_MYCGU|nr:hypothetical protein MGAD_09000 [Mycolicibacterium gadium]
MPPEPAVTPASPLPSASAAAGGVAKAIAAVSVKIRVVCRIVPSKAPISGAMGNSGRSIGRQGSTVTLPYG